MLHVHGVFPYVYIPFYKDFKRQFIPETTTTTKTTKMTRTNAENDDVDPNQSPAVKLLLVRFANSVDKALNISMGRGK